MAVNVWNLKVGDKVREKGKAYDLTVSFISPPMSGGRAEHHGPRITAHIRPGGYSVDFDAQTADRFDNL
ncbi:MULTISPECIES: hypothetical protein [Mycolicibacterium]|uniref:Uncharacterized protein n=1 Tax=Mycolicibacterium nivoides TaxID=2487344 RepID=A0ABW9LMK7_9MYCO|nr:hypothetical protein [Mycolicibacterium fortuitum]UBV13404.1 hypothetical protein H8Z57_21515 [Mycolicibacterium fortuitum]